MKYEIDGVSTPFGGVSWSKSTTAKDRFKFLFVFFESKRILTNPSEMELKPECIHSVIEIKSILSETTKDVNYQDKDLEIVRNLIDACNAYLNAVNDKPIPHLIYKNGDLWADLSFDKAMKNFRSSFRIEIKNIETLYKLKFNKLIPERY